MSNMVARSRTCRYCRQHPQAHVSHASSCSKASDDALKVCCIADSVHHQIFPNFWPLFSISREVNPSIFDFPFADGHIQVSSTQAGCHVTHVIVLILLLSFVLLHDKLLKLADIW